MDRDAFTRELGLRQGRIQPAGVAPLAGSHVFCLGWDGEGHYEELAPGDFVQIEQEATFTPGTKVFRATAIVRPPSYIPPGHKWVLRLLVDDVVLVEHRLIEGGRTRQLVLSANVSKVAPGNHFVTLRLQFLTDDDVQYIVAADFECGP